MAYVHIISVLSDFKIQVFKKNRLDLSFKSFSEDINTWLKVLCYLRICTDEYKAYSKR
jgi:hypothetical protein